MPKEWRYTTVLSYLFIKKRGTSRKVEVIGGIKLILHVMKLGEKIIEKKNLGGKDHSRGIIWVYA